MASHNRTHASDRGKVVVDIPGIPTIGTATAGPESATVAFTENVKGGAATTWTALSNPGSITGTGSSSPVTVEGLTAGTSYTFTVRGTNSTGTGEYSAASNSIVPTVGTAYESIATVSVGAGGSSTVSFTSIPSTYKHLQIRGFVRTANPGQFSVQKMTFNSDTSSSNYVTLHQIYGFGASVASQSSTGNGWIYQSYLAGANAPANMFGGFVTDILDYTSTNKNKTTRTLAGTDQNGAGAITFGSGLWMNSSTAINRIDIVDDSAGNISQYSQFALYGIKG